VLREVAAVAELVVADDARVALLAGVSDHVTLERRRVDESLGADRADVWALAGVRPHVLLQQHQRPFITKHTSGSCAPSTTSTSVYYKTHIRFMCSFNNINVRLGLKN